MVPSVQKAVRILELIAKEPGLTVSKVSERLGLPKSSAHDILATLEDESLVFRTHAGGGLHLGIRLFELGNKSLGDFEIRKASEASLRWLNKELDETVHLTILDNDEVLYVECFESTKRLRIYSVIGVRAPLHCTAVGKAIMAYLPEAEVDRIVAERGLPKMTENTIIDAQELKKELVATVRRGYAIDNSEHEEGVRCVAAPIRSRSGEVIASISVSGPDQRIAMGDVPQLAILVVKAANEISLRMGAR